MRYLLLALAFFSTLSAVAQQYLYLLDHEDQPVFAEEPKPGADYIYFTVDGRGQRRDLPAPVPAGDLLLSWVGDQQLVRPARATMRLSTQQGNEVPTLTVITPDKKYPLPEVLSMLGGVALAMRGPGTFGFTPDGRYLTVPLPDRFGNYGTHLYDYRQPFTDADKEAMQSTGRPSKAAYENGTMVKTALGGFPAGVHNGKLYYLNFDDRGQGTLLMASSPYDQPSTTVAEVGACRGGRVLSDEVVLLTKGRSGSVVHYVPSGQQVTVELPLNKIFYNHAADQLAFLVDGTTYRYDWPTLEKLGREQGEAMSTNETTEVDTESESLSVSTSALTRHAKATPLFKR